MGNFEKLSVLVIVVIIVMILVVALYTWTDDPDGTTTTAASGTTVAAGGGGDGGAFLDAGDGLGDGLGADLGSGGAASEGERSGDEVVDPLWVHVPPRRAPGPIVDDRDNDGALAADVADVVDDGDASADDDASGDAVARDAAAERTVVVKRGDTLGHISLRAYGTTRHWKRIQEHNGLSRPQDIRPGQKLLLPAIDGAGGSATIAADGSGPRPGTTYTVRSGDTIQGISKRAYGTEDRWPDIWVENLDVLPDFTDVRAGLTLHLP